MSADIIKRMTFAEQVLSHRELEVFRLYGLGNTPTEIGKLIHLSPKTISTHRCTIMRKMGFKSTYELMHHAIKSEIRRENE